jgi:hypothetical protein
MEKCVFLDGSNNQRLYLLVGFTELLYSTAVEYKRVHQEPKETLSPVNKESN